MITVLVASSRVPGIAARVGVEKRLHLVVATAGLPPGEQIEATGPDVLLLDLGGERLSDWLRAAASSRPPPAIVVIADEARALDDEWVGDAGRAVLPRRASPREIAAAIEAAAAGLIVAHPDAGARARAPRRRATPDSRPLTTREIEVLGAMAEGLGNKAIAARLGISPHTIKFHVASIFAKLAVESRTEAVTAGIRRGLVLI